MIHESARDRLPDVFATSEYVIEKLHQWIDVSQPSAPTTRLDIVLVAIVVRAFNLYRSINNLLATDHWEDAGILSRSMYELVLNLEEIQRDKGKEEAKAGKYLKFSLLQKFLHRKMIIEYYHNTGADNKEEYLKVKELERNAKSLFKEFRSSRGYSEWQDYWHGKSVYKLAQESKNKMRLPHYEISYSFFSALSHSGPTPVMSQMIIGNTEKETEELSQIHLSEDEKTNLILVLSLATVWLLEIVLRCRTVIPLYDPQWNEIVSNKFHELILTEK